MTTEPKAPARAAWVPHTHDFSGVLPVAQHDVVDLLLSTEAGSGNPFDIEIRVTLVGPEGAMLTVPAFWDPHRGHVVRVSAPRPGSWRLTVTHAPDELELRDRYMVLDAGPAKAGVTAPLMIDPERPQHFLRADGTRVFVRGYEVNWLLMVDQHDPTLARVIDFLDTIEPVGFNMVTVNAYARSFRRHVPEDLEKDPRWVLPSLAPWIGGNEAPDYEQLDPDFFAHMDDAIALLQQRGLIVHLMIHVYNKDVNWPELGSADDDRYWRHIVARYQAFGNILWDTGKESYHQSSDYIWTRVGLIRRYDGYRRLVTAHDVNPPDGHGWGLQYKEPVKEYLDDIVDVTSDQVLLDIYGDALRHTTRFSKPYINVEFGYESGIDDLPSDAEDHDQPWDEVTRRHWQVVMGGGYPNYYYRNTAWSLFLPKPTPPGYAAIKVLAEFWDATQYWLMTPAPHLLKTEATDVYARAHEGSEYVVYSQSGASFSLEVEVPGPTRATWLDPYTGRTEPAGEVSSGTHQFDVPWPDSAAVLHIRTA